MVPIISEPTALRLRLFCLYMASSASFTVSSAGPPGTAFTAQPTAMLALMALTRTFENSSLILTMIFSAVPAVVRGRMMVNSSPPTLEMMSPSLQLFLRASAAFFSSSSPAAWPKTSFVSFRPFRSPKIIVRGRFSSLFSLFSSSSKYALLYRPVRLSW